MNYNNPIPEKTAGIVRYSCGFLFLAFCFSFLFFIQGDVLAEVQHMMSNGLTKYSIVVGAVLITVVLQIIQWVVGLFIHFPNKCYAISYLPSYLGLAMLSDLDSNIDGDFVWGCWRWLMPLLLVLWIIVIGIVKSSESDENDRHHSMAALLLPNYLIIFIMILGVGFVPSIKSVKQCELKVERLICDKNYVAATAVGINAWESSERLTQLRMYALSKQGLLGDSIFCYPQEFGAKGLLDIKDTSLARRFPTRNIEFSLGAFPGVTIKSTKRFLERLAEDSIATEQGKQYLLCYALLEKNMMEFNERFTSVYGDTIECTVPRAYQEAIVMQHPEYTVDSLPIYINKEYVKMYHDYLNMKEELGDNHKQKNLTRRKYGKCYWWYYDNK